MRDNRQATVPLQPEGPPQETAMPAKEENAEPAGRAEGSQPPPADWEGVEAPAEEVPQSQAADARESHDAALDDDPTAGQDSLRKALRRNLSLGRLGLLLKRAFGTLRSRGWQALGREFAFRWNLATHGETWRYRADMPLRRELRAQRRGLLRDQPLISVVVPLYNTPKEYLTQMVDSVRAQSYANWQLVMVDGSDAQHRYVGQLADRCARKEPRIRYVKLHKNEGIAGNTNLGIADSDGEYVVLLDHDDVLQPNALYEVAKAINETAADLIYSDEVVLDARLRHLWEFHFKPDYAPDTLRGCNYITHLCAFSRILLEKAGGGERPVYEGAQDYDLILRLTENARHIHHIPKVLYFWRRHAQSTAQDIGQKPYAVAAGAAAVAEQLERLDLDGSVTPMPEHPGAYRIHYPVWGVPLVSVLIPNKDHTDDLKRCLDSLYAKAGWREFEVLVLENNSTDPATEPFYQEAEALYPNLRVHRYTGVFNFAALCNFGAQRAKGSQLLLLNNDTEIISENFLPEMLGYSQRPDVGAVGALLYYPDDTVQHAGLIVGIGGTAGVSHKGHPRGDGGDLYRLATVQNISAVTGACLMVKKALYDSLQGMDAENFGVAFNDVDFCLRLVRQGLWNIFTPFAQAYHYESKSRGYDIEGENKTRFDREAAALRSLHAEIFEKGDPFYNPHFTMETENFALK